MRKVVVASFSLPPATWRRAGELMRAQNRSRSAVVAEAIETYYTMRQWDDLQATGAGRARKLGIRNEDDVERVVHEYRGRHR